METTEGQLLAQNDRAGQQQSKDYDQRNRLPLVSDMTKEALSEGYMGQELSVLGGGCCP